MKSKKPNKKKTGATKKRARVSSKSKSTNLKVEKRRGKGIYDVIFPSGSKTESGIDSVIDSLNYKSIRDSNEFVKITFVSKFRKKHASISYIQEYDFETKKELNEQIKQSLKDINYTIFRKPVKGTGDSVKRMNRLKNYLSRIIIDFEGAD
jgi:hypothetical protein